MTQDDARAELAVLTARQLEALILRAKGETLEGIGQAMGCSAKGAEAHMKQVAKRLQCNSYAACWLVGKAGMG